MLRELEMGVNYFGPLQVTRAIKTTPVFSASGAIANVLFPVARHLAARRKLLSLEVGGASVDADASGGAEAKRHSGRHRHAGPDRTRLTALMPEPKLRPSQVAVEALDALNSGLEEVFTGEPTKDRSAALQG